MVISGVVYSVGDWIAQVSFCVVVVQLSFNLVLKLIILLCIVFVAYLFIYLFIFIYHCSALKENLSLSLTVRGCSDQALLVLLYMALFLITIISFAR